MSAIDGIVTAAGLPRERRETVAMLVGIFNRMAPRNRELRSYYEGDIAIKDIGVDAVPPDIRIHFSCDWPARAVDAVADRVRLSGFTFEDGTEDEGLSRIVRDARIIEKFANHLPDELIHGCMAGVVGRYNGRTYVRFHSAESCAMAWDASEERIGAGLVIAQEGFAPWSPNAPVPLRVNLHMPGLIGTFVRTDAAHWSYAEAPTPMAERPMMEAFCFRATGQKPLGRSRITRNVMDIADEVLRIKEYMAFSGAISAAPQKWIMNLTDEMYDKLTNSKWSTYIGSWVMATGDEDGNAPKVGQFPQASPLPYIEMLRQQASDFSASTGIPMSMLVDHDNPASEAGIIAQSEGLIGVADRLIESSQASLRELALMLMAVDAGVGTAALDERKRSVVASFKSPLRHTRAENADAAYKIAKARPGFAQTDVFLEMNDFDQSEIRRIKSQEAETDAEDVLVQIQEQLASPMEVPGGDGADE